MAVVTSPTNPGGISDGVIGLQGFTPLGRRAARAEGGGAELAPSALETYCGQKYLGDSFIKVATNRGGRYSLPVPVTVFSVWLRLCTCSKLHTPSPRSM